MYGYSKSKLIILIAGVLLLAACGNGEPEPVVPVSPDSITVLADSVSIEKGGTAKVQFTVSPPDFQFNYHVGAAGCCIALGGSVGRFYLEDVVRTGNGEYEAVLKDNGTEGSYALPAVIVYSKDGVSVNSLPFTVVRTDPEVIPEYTMTGLPVVYLRTSGPVNSKENWVSGTISIDGTEELPGLDQMSCQVKGRGNTTWSWPKKPYTIKLEKKTSVFGMPAHKRWVLLANFMDRTLMRNLVSMKVGSMLDNLAWTPRCQCVELVMNGSHRGTYLLIEQVRVDKNRVNIDEKNGFMLECDFHYDNEIQWLDPHGRCNNWSDAIPFSINHPDTDTISAPYVQKIKDYIYEVAEALYSDGFEEKYPAYLDVDSFVDYWIAFEVMGNHELQNPGSVYMHRDKDGLLTAGPLWDFDWGVLSYNTSPGARTGLIDRHAIWYDRLFDDPAFRAKVKARWEQVLPELRTVVSYINEQKKLLEKTAKLNFAMWNPAEDANMNGWQIINGDENMSYSAAVDRLRTIYSERLNVISSALSSM